MSAPGIRLGIIGAGVIVEHAHLPAAAHAGSGVRVTHLIDLNPLRAAELAQRFDIPHTGTDHRSLFGQVDAVLIATPNHTHAPLAIDCLQHGLHVLCEKPLATSAEDARRMLQASRTAGRQLAVGMVRRVAPAALALQRLLEQGRLGELTGFEVREGVQLSWVQHSSFLFDSRQSGGGVLINIGIHAVDLTLGLFGPLEQLDRYEDDDCGTGSEAEARLELRVTHRGRSVPGVVDISFLRAMSFRLSVAGTAGIATLEGWDRLRLETPRGTTDVPCPPDMAASGAPAPNAQLAAFITQFARFSRAATGGEPLCVSVDQALPALETIERCYRQRRLCLAPYEAVGLDGLLTPAADRSGQAASTVLVTGANGFIGCRVVERLVAEGHRVRAMIHRWDRPAIPRLARLPRVEFVVADLCDAASLAKAVQGATAIVHCARGTGSTDADRQRATVDGTQLLLEHARQQGVARVVHLSTLSVFGLRPKPGTHDDSPFQPGDNSYGDQKIAAEEQARAAFQQHRVPVIILRPGGVYGPYSSTWTLRLIEEARRGLWLPDDGDAPANLIYIDNLVDAILLALASERGVGEAFNLVDEDAGTWREVYQAHAALLPSAGPIEGRPYDALVQAAREAVRPRWLMEVLPQVARVSAGSAEGRQLLRQTVEYRAAARWMPALLRMAKRVSPAVNGGAVPPQGPVLLAEEWLKFYSSPMRYRSEKAARVLGYRQRITMQDGMRYVRQFLERHGCLNTAA